MLVVVSHVNYLGKTYSRPPMFARALEQRLKRSWELKTIITSEANMCLSWFKIKYSPPSNAEETWVASGLTLNPQKGRIRVQFSTKIPGDHRELSKNTSPKKRIFWFWVFLELLFLVKHQHAFKIRSVPNKKQLWFCTFLCWSHILLTNI